MSEHFAIAVEWPDDPRPYLVHLKKPYFVAEIRRYGDTALFITTLRSEQLRHSEFDLDPLLSQANSFSQSALGISMTTAQFLKGKHGREFPRYLMARTGGGLTFIVEPEHPAPLVAVTEPAPEKARPKLSSRFDVVTQWRLAQMRKYYQQFQERQRGHRSQELSVPAF
jgi:hypothetical protein